MKPRKKPRKKPRATLTAMLAIGAVGVMVFAYILVSTPVGPGLASGKYRMTIMVHTGNEDTGREIVSEVNVTMGKDGGMRIVNPLQAEFPIVAKIERDRFSGVLSDAGGKVALSGALTSKNEITGTLANIEHKAGQANIHGTFRIAR